MAKKMLSLPSQRKYRALIVLALVLCTFLWTVAQPATGPGVILPSRQAPGEIAGTGEFTVITYNIAGLPGIISSAATKRSSSIATIGGLLNKFDIAHVQEDFNYNKHLYGNNVLAHKTSPKGKVPFGDGLNTLSKYPVHQVRRIAWKDCTGADCFTPKGFSYSRIEVAENVFIDFYNVHANANNHHAAAAARRKNIKQLSEYIKEHSDGHAVIVMGDLNGHYSYHYDNLTLLLSENKLLDVWMEHNRKGRLPAVSEAFPDDNILALADSSETIDKILYRSSQQIELKTADYKLENILFCNNNGLALSDHHPVSARIAWQVFGQMQPEPKIALRNNK